ncbi:MAG: hypothetical protein JXR52_05010 [Bacteroidales bacterium]|nr:hypothetical protein [Bacteroidales bacterium]MBN2698164.1 hypothetical protein [Bacteroidales bacterium]
MRYFGIIIIVTWAILNVSGQSDSIRMVKYNPDFEFNDGIYANFNMVKANNPIPFARIVTDVDLFDPDFYEKVTSNNEIIYYDNNGVKQILKTRNIWGYGRNGVLYINIGETFHRISYLGNISHFVASITTYNPNYYDPYGYYPYYYNPYYYNRYMTPRSGYSNTELKQYLMDFETGEVYEYDIESVEILLMKDPELYNEYVSLRRKKKNQLKFVYIRKFNEKHPIYLPSE